MLPYSSTELAANRHGKMTTSQQQQLGEQLGMAQRGINDEITQFSVVLVAVIGITFVAGISGGMSMVILAGMVVAYGIFKYFDTGILRKLAADVESGKVLALQGSVRLKTRQFMGQATYRLEVPSMRYRTQIEQRLYRALKEGHTYRLYVADLSGALLSMEPWSEDH